MSGMPMSWARRTVIWLRDFSMPKRSVDGPADLLLLVVLRLPDVLAGPLLDLDRRVEHDRRRLVAVVERRRVDERLERRAGLALGLDGAVELAHGEREAADDGQHAAGVRVHGDEAAADLGDLHQRPDAGEVGGVLRRDLDHVARTDNSRSRPCGGACLAGDFAHFISSKRDLDRLALGDQRAVLLLARAAGRRRPWSSARRARRRAARARCRAALRCAPSGAPQSPEMSILRDRAAPALLRSNCDEAVDQRRAGDLLQPRIERRADRQAAAVELVLAVAGRAACGAPPRRRYSAAKMCAPNGADVDRRAAWPWPPRPRPRVM